MSIKRVIPCLDVKEGRVVKGVKFVNLRDAGDPVELASAYNKEGADELVFLDITATTERRRTIIDVAEQACEKVSIPFIVGGGIKTLEDIRSLINVGVNKVSIGSAVVHYPSLLTMASGAFGSEAIICAIDAKRNSDGSDRWSVCINGGNTVTDLDVIEWAVEASRCGAGEILLTSLDRDGTKEGFDLALTRAVARAVDVPVVASGGAGTLEHFAEGVLEGEADGVLGASVFHFGEFSIRQVKAYMASQGIEVRLD